jgi:hypothetical protein
MGAGPGPRHPASAGFDVICWTVLTDGCDATPLSLPFLRSLDVSAPRAPWAGRHDALQRGLQMLRLPARVHGAGLLARPAAPAARCSAGPAGGRRSERELVSGMTAEGAPTLRAAPRAFLAKAERVRCRNRRDFSASSNCPTSCSRFLRPLAITPRAPVTRFVGLVFLGSSPADAKPSRTKRQGERRKKCRIQ